MSVHSNFDTTSTHRGTQGVRVTPPAQSEGGSQVRRFKRICGGGEADNERRRGSWSVLIASTIPPSSSANASSSSSSAAIVARAASSSSSSVAQGGQVTGAAPSPLPTQPFDGNGHPYLNTLLQYASAYASGVAISGGILSRREEAEAVLISLFWYIETWSTLHSTGPISVFCYMETWSTLHSTGTGRGIVYEEYSQDLGRIIGACVSLEMQLRMEGASDQVVLAEAIEERACNGLRRGLSCLALMDRHAMTQEARRKRLRYDVAFTPYFPDPSAPAQRHAEFLTARRSIGIRKIQDVLRFDREQKSLWLRMVGAPEDVMELYNFFVDIRTGEQILSYINGSNCSIDAIAPSSFEQFMECDDKVGLIRRMVSAIEQSSPDELNATVRSNVETGEGRGSHPRADHRERTSYAAGQSGKEKQSS